MALQSTDQLCHLPAPSESFLEMLRCATFRPQSCGGPTLALQLTPSPATARRLHKHKQNDDQRFSLLDEWKGPLGPCQTLLEASNGDSIHDALPWALPPQHSH